MNEPKILIIDDASFMRGVLKNILEEAGYTDIIEADTADTAITKFMTERPHLVLLDIMMPEVDGLSVLEDIGKKTKVIVISKIKDTDLEQKAQALGAKAYIHKPFNQEDVCKKIAQVLAQE